MDEVFSFSPMLPHVLLLEYSVQSKSLVAWFILQKLATLILAFQFSQRFAKYFSFTELIEYNSIFFVYSIFVL